jgi:hypothetical protein
MRFILSKLHLAATAMAAMSMFASASAHAGLVFTPVVANVDQNDTSATITVDVYGRENSGGGVQALSTYGIRLSASAGTLTSADSSNAIVQDIEWQKFQRQNLPGVTDVVFQGGQSDGPNSIGSFNIQGPDSRIGQAVFTVLKTNFSQLVSFSLSAGPTKDVIARSGALVSTNNPGVYTDVSPLTFNNTSANVSALAAVPEPSSLVLTSLLLGGIPYGIRRRRQAKARVVA